jgi:hypothetical protein
MTLIEVGVMVGGDIVSFLTILKVIGIIFKGWRPFGG